MTYGIMAALMRHGLQIRGHRLKTVYNHVLIVVRSKTDYTRFCKEFIVRGKHPRPTLKGKNDLSPCNTELPRDYLRPGKSYNVPENITNDFNALCLSILDTSCSSRDIIPHEQKYKLLEACFQTFNHSVPNGILHTIQTKDDILNFYKTAVNPTIPLDAMKNMDLPPNLHVLYEYHRFNPETDTMFGGVSAFPKSSTIVTGLKYKKKYSGYKAKSSWP